MIESLNIFKKVEELIKEHGSASILRDHVNLLREQFSLLEKQNTLLNNKIDTLESQIQDCNEEKQRLNEIIKTLRENQSIKKFEKETEEILKVFFDEAKELDVNHFTSIFPSVQPSVVNYHFDILRKNKMIVQTRAGTEIRSITRPPGFSITPKGREYVIRNMST